MKSVDPGQKILSRDQLIQQCALWRSEGKTIVTTNGAFDLLHPGHISNIKAAAEFADILVIGINSDTSVKRYKSVGRPFLPQELRAFQIAALPWVDAVHIFDEDDPIRFLQDVVPHFHCKGSQYSLPLLEEPALRAMGGQVRLLPMVEGLSSTELSRKIFESQLSQLVPSMKERVSIHMKYDQSPSAYAFKGLLTIATEALRRGNKLLFCGNGGSAASAQHFAAEYVGRFKLERQALSAIALTVDTSILTSIANDYGYEQVFSRQLDALARPGDVLIALSTSGKSPNVVRAMELARTKGVVTACFVGQKHPDMPHLAQYSIIIPTTETTIIQEMTDFLLHQMCDTVEKELAKPSAP